MRAPSPPAAGNTIVITISPDGSDTTGDGTAARPFFSPTRARDAIRSARQQVYHHQAPPVKESSTMVPVPAATVLLRGGVYMLGALPTVQLTAADSNTQWKADPADTSGTVIALPFFDLALFFAGDAPDHTLARLEASMLGARPHSYHYHFLPPLKVSHPRCRVRSDSPTSIGPCTRQVQSRWPPSQPVRGALISQRSSYLPLTPGMVVMASGIG